MNFREAVLFLTTAARERVPSLDVSETSPVRWLFDTVAELHGKANLATDEAISWNIASKTGADLDDFVEHFGMRRMPGRHATGTVTLLFGAPTTRPYLVKQGTELYTRSPNSSPKIFLVANDTPIPRLSAFATLPIISSDIGGYYNVRANEIKEIDEELENLVSIRNEEPLRGGKGEETDGELQKRFRTDLFRNILGNEAWYRQIASRHPQVSAVQLLRPTQEAEEHLKIVNGQVVCTEDSLKYTYANLFSIYVPRTDQWLTQERDFVVTLDNENPSPPVIRFQGDNYEEGDSVIVRYQYCSKKSRNDPVTADMRYLDLFVTGNNPAPTIDFSTWNERNIIGAYNVNQDTHPTSTTGRPYYVFVRQPVDDIPSEIEIQGRRYYKNRDYQLVKDRTVFQNSGQARDVLQWNSTLPEGRFQMPYFHNLVISDIQSVVDEPDMHTAIDDVLVHSAEEIEFDVKVTVEWERGKGSEDNIKEALQTFFTEVEMGTSIKYGEIMKILSDVPQVEAIFLEEISTERLIRGKNSWRKDVPLPDGTVPKLRNLVVETTAPNLY